MADEKIAGLLNRQLILCWCESRQFSEFVAEMRLIGEAAPERQLGPIDAPRSLRDGVYGLEAEDAAERLWRQSDFGPKDGQEPSMTQSASSRDVSDCRAETVGPKAVEGIRHDRMQRSIRSEPGDQDALEVLEACAV